MNRDDLLQEIGTLRGRAWSIRQKEPELGAALFDVAGTLEALVDEVTILRRWVDATRSDLAELQTMTASQAQRLAELAKHVDASQPGGEP